MLHTANPTVNARKTNTICLAGKALRCQDEGGGGCNLSDQPEPPLHPPGQCWALETPFSLCPPESPWQQKQALLKLKVSRRLSTFLAANLLQVYKTRKGGLRVWKSSWGNLQVRWADIERVLWCGLGVSVVCMNFQQNNHLRATPGIHCPNERSRRTISQMSQWRSLKKWKSIQWHAKAFSFSMQNM